MSVRIGVVVCSMFVLLAGCTGRHVVTEREAGRVDGERSVSTSSDTTWQIQQEPAAGGAHSR